MKTKWSKTTIWQSILSVLILGIFIVLAAGSIFGVSQQKKDLGNGLFELSKYYSDGKGEIMTGPTDRYGRWNGQITIKHENQDGEVIVTEEVMMVDGLRHGMSKITNANGVVIHYYHMGERLKDEKSANMITAENSALSVLSYKSPWFQYKLGAFDFNTAYLKAYMDTLETLMYKSEFEVADFDTYYNDAVDSLRETPYDSIITFNSELTLYQGLDLMKNSEFRLAVMDRYRSPGSTTFSIINQTYPCYLKSLNDSGVVNPDFEIFCHQMDSVMISYGSISLEDPFFIDSVDARIYRSLITIINAEKSISTSTQLALKSASLIRGKINIMKFTNDLKSILNPLTMSSTPSKVGELVLTFMLLQYIDGDLFRKSFMEACYLKKSIARVPVATTILESSSSSTTAILGGNVIEDGGAPVSVKGIAWATTYNPSVTDHTKTSGAGTGEFSITADGLIKGTTYYARSFATNSVGTKYGNCISFIAGDPSGINEKMDNSQKLTIYPNPATTSAMFKFNLECSGTKSLSILDMKGQEVVYKELGNLPEGEQQIELNLAGLPNGMYTCRLIDGISNNATGKLVISRN